MSLKKAHGRSVLHPKSIEKTSVKLATAVVSESTRDTLRHYAQDTDKTSWTGTADVLSLMLKLWNVINVKKGTKGKHKWDMTMDPVRSSMDWKLIFLRSRLSSALGGLSEAWIDVSDFPGVASHLYSLSWLCQLHVRPSGLQLGFAGSAAVRRNWKSFRLAASIVWSKLLHLHDTSTGGRSKDLRIVVGEVVSGRGRQCNPGGGK